MVVLVARVQHIVAVQAPAVVRQRFLGKRADHGQERDLVRLLGAGLLKVFGDVERAELRVSRQEQAERSALAEKPVPLRTLRLLPR